MSRTNEDSPWSHMSAAQVIDPTLPLFWTIQVAASGRKRDFTAEVIARIMDVSATAAKFISEAPATAWTNHATKGIAEGYDLDTGLPNPAYAIAAYQVTPEGRSECIGYVDQNAEWSEEFPAFSIHEAVKYAQALNERDVREQLVYCAEIVR